MQSIKLKNMVLFLFVFLFLTFLMIDLCFSKSPNEIAYELEKEYIENRDDLSWSEKVKEQEKLLNRRFPDSDSGKRSCWLCFGIIFLGVVVAIIKSSLDNKTNDKKTNDSFSKNEKRDEIIFELAEEEKDLNGESKAIDYRESCEICGNPKSNFSADINRNVCYNCKVKEYNTIKWLMKCPDCGKDVSKRAAACPNCGCPISKINEFLSDQIK
jgi:hypothetical protein